jgi:serine/threonine protein kinase
VYAIRRSSQRIYAPNGLSYRLHELAHTEVDPPLKYRGKCYDLSASSNETWSEFENQVKRHGDVLVKLLNTEHVAKWVTHFFDPATDGFWVIEEWFDGESLESIFRGRQEKELNISDVMKQVALGLRELHNPPSALDRIRKITLPKMYHRNLNPSAIWIVRSTKHVILTDFELAKMEGSTYSAVLDKFTPNPYIAPEVIAKAHQANEKSDLYSWGAILFRLVTGGEYAAAKRAEAEQILLSSKLPSTIVDITLKCLEELPSDRPENIDVVIKAISGWK